MIAFETLLLWIRVLEFAALGGAGLLYAVLFMFLFGLPSRKGLAPRRESAYSNPCQ